jgi:hypothetical protein
MADRGVIPDCGMQFQLSLFPDQLGLCGAGKTSNNETEQDLEHDVHKRIKRDYNFSVKRRRHQNGGNFYSVFGPLRSLFSPRIIIIPPRNTQPLLEARPN